MSELVPEGWQTLELGQGISILSGYPFPSACFSDDQSKIGLIRIRDLQRQTVGTFYSGKYSDEFIVSAGDVLVGMDGDFNAVKWKARKALLNQRICKVEASSDEFDTGFIFYTLTEELAKIHSATGATTVKHLSVKDIRGITKPLPPKPEQQKIASILTSVDEVIDKTEAQISKLQDLKKGMMQELLTKGIGHTEFKDSPVGRIPKSWETVHCGEICSKVTDGEHLSPKYVEDGFPILSAKDITEYGVSFTGQKLVDSDDFNKMLRRCKPEKSDVLIVSRGATIGKVTTNETDKSFALMGSVILLKPDHQVVTGKYLAAFLSDGYAQDAMLNLSGSSAQQAIYLKDIKDLQVPLPSLAEQKKITDSLESVGVKVRNSQVRLRKFKNLKCGLMQDLLTGKVRVKVN